MWTYWRLLEGEVYVDAPYRTAGDLDPPVLHVELMSTPVIDRSTGRELADHLYVYWKNGAERMDRPGVQGGTIPIKIGPNAVTDPYGHDNDEYQAEPGFADYLTSAMGQLMTRFEGSRKHFRDRRNGGIGAFTPDNVPIFDWITPNVYMIADSNHGFKMTGAGKLVAKLLAGGGAVAGIAAVRVRPLRQGQDVRREQQPLPVGMSARAPRRAAGKPRSAARAVPSARASSNGSPTAPSSAPRAISSSSSAAATCRRARSCRKRCSIIPRSSRRSIAISCTRAPTSSKPSPTTRIARNCGSSAASTSSRR